MRFKIVSNGEKRLICPLCDKTLDWYRERPADPRYGVWTVPRESFPHPAQECIYPTSWDKRVIEWLDGLGRKNYAYEVRGEWYLRQPQATDDGVFYFLRPCWEGVTNVEFALRRSRIEHEQEVDHISAILSVLGGA